MRASTLAAVIGSLFVSQTYACIYFNATLTPDQKLSVYSWDDKNNSNRTDAHDIFCIGNDLTPVSDNHWTVKCNEQEDAKSDTVFEVYLEPVTTRFIDIIYQYSNPDDENLQEGKSENPDEFLFNFRVGSVDGKFFKAREFCGQYDLFRLIKPEALKNPCDSLDSC